MTVNVIFQPEDLICHWDFTSSVVIKQTPHEVLPIQTLVLIMEVVPHVL